MRLQKNIDFGSVADIYDIYVQWDDDVAFFKQTCAQTEGEILELMSGTGRLSIPLLKAGVQLSCVDYSAEMLDVLKRRLRENQLTAPIYEQDIRALTLGRHFDLILLPFHSLAEILTSEDRRKALQRVRQHLTSEGRLIVTLQNPMVQIPQLNGERKQLSNRSIPGREEDTLRVWTTARRSGDLAYALQEYEISDRHGHVIERRELQVQFALIDRATFENEAWESGLQTVHLWGDYSQGAFVRERSPFMIWELTPKLECVRLETKER